MMIKDIISLNPHQYDIAITASYYTLGLMSNEYMTTFTHRLMERGYYDDIMLDIIDDDPLYPNSQIAELLPVLYGKLGFCLLSWTESCYLYTLDTLLPLLNLPPNVDKLSECYVNDKFGLYGYEDEEALAQDLLDRIYQLSYELEWLDMENPQNLPQTKNQLLYEFMQDCHIWLNKHQTTFNAIFSDLPSYDRYHLPYQPHHQTCISPTYPSPYSQKKRANGDRRRAFIRRLF